MNFRVLLFSSLTLLLHLGNRSALASTVSYDSIYPYYVEYCAVTQLKPLDGTNGGGTGGHGVLFLKGVCRDRSAAYPRLKLCEEGSIDLSNPEAGTSISVDQIFQNANWVALDGKDLLITGGLSEDKRLDLAAQEKLISRVMSLDLFRGVKIHPEYMKDKPKGMTDDEYVVRQTLATEFALNFGRNVYCARLPIKKEMLSPMVENLNSLNDYYQKNGDYEWSAIYNNCAQTAHNAIAAAGLFRPYALDQNIFKQAFNLGIPSQEFIDLERMGNDDTLDDAISIYQDPYKRKALLEQDWMAMQPGVLTDNHRIHQNNALYDTNSDFFILDIPGANPRRNEFNQINSESRYSDVLENLRYFETKYRAALESRLSIADLREIVEARSRGSAIAPPKINTREFEQFYNAYYLKLEKALGDVQKKLSVLEIK